MSVPKKRIIFKTKLPKGDGPNPVIPDQEEFRCHSPATPVLPFGPG